MTDLDALGARHKELLAEIDAVRAALPDAIRAERANTGATYLNLAHRAGYTTETVRQILNPQARDKANRVRRSATVDQ